MQLKELSELIESKVTAKHLKGLTFEVSLSMFSFMSPADPGSGNLVAYNDNPKWHDFNIQISRDGRPVLREQITLAAAMLEDQTLDEVATMMASHLDGKVFEWIAK